MGLLSKEIEIQSKLATIYEQILIQKDVIYQELVHSRKQFDKACDRHICTGYVNENEWLAAKALHQEKYMAYDVYCHITNIMQDFKDVYDHFPDYIQMYRTIHLFMLRFAESEDYELAGILKRWVDQIQNALHYPN